MALERASEACRPTTRVPVMRGQASLSRCKSSADLDTFVERQFVTRKMKRRTNGSGAQGLVAAAAAAAAAVLVALMPSLCYAGKLPTMLVESGKPKCVLVSVPMDTQLRVDYEAPGKLVDTLHNVLLDDT